MKERELQDAVIELARLLGWRVAHFRAAQTGRGWRTPVEADGAGFPDLILAKPGRPVIFAELKSSVGLLSDQQGAWFGTLELARAQVHIWRPADWMSGRIEAVLRAETAPAPQPVVRVTMPDGEIWNLEPGEVNFNGRTFSTPVTLKRRERS